MTSHQQTVVNQLRQEYGSVEVQNDRAGTSSVIVDCYAITHRLVPTKTFRISPSGFRQDVTPERV